MDKKIKKVTQRSPSPTKSVQGSLFSQNRKLSPKKPFTLQNSKLNLTGMLDGVSLAPQNNIYTPPQR